ncbi:MAG: arabinan endo-1,5-alpha-L-arabinosidase [Anaerolineae bacterium]
MIRRALVRRSEIDGRKDIQAMPENYTRRQFLRSSLAGAGLGLSLGLPVLGQTPETTPEVDMHLRLLGSISPVHDPVIIRDEDTYYLFCTGDGIPLRQSSDMLDWRIQFPPRILAHVPDWAKEKIPGATNIWAPDISYFNGKFHLYYAVSTFGSNRSVIGLATNPTLHFGSDGYKWTDEGLVLESTNIDNYNCIDPNLIVDQDGIPWLAFGSFWSGIKMRRLDYETGKPSAEDETLYSLARRTVNSGSVEAPFIIYRDGFYYLFVSFDFCCRGVDSTYNVRVGRSESITGPYLDRDGIGMMAGGGTQVTFPTDRWKGPGHNAIMRDNGVDYIVYHAYDALAAGTPTLRIAPLSWDDDGWVSVATPSE